MKAMDFLTLLGDLDEGESEHPVPIRNQRRRAPRIVAAACASVLCLLFAVWFFTPPPVSTAENGGLYTVVRIGDRLAFYRQVIPARLSPYERLCLPNERGEILAVHGDFTFHRAADRDDLVYILTDGPGGHEKTVLEFAGIAYWPNVDLKSTEWYAAGRISDEDIAALENASVPTMKEILETVYGVTSVSDIRRIRFEKDNADNGPVGKRVRVSSVTARDSETIGRIYTLLAGMTPTEIGQKLPFSHVSPLDEAYLNGESPLSAQVNRDITVQLESGYTLRFTFSPVTGLLRQYQTDMYTILSEEDTAWLIRFAAIDMEWRDWGTEAADPSGAGDATAVVPPVATPEGS